MSWNIEYAHPEVEAFVLGLPPGLRAKYFRLTELMEEFGANLGMPHSRPMSEGLFELRVRDQEGIARVFYCTLIGKRIVMLHGFIKKTQKTPAKDSKLARKRLLEVKGK
jgi:phage-related protein